MIIKMNSHRPSHHHHQHSTGDSDSMNQEQTVTQCPHSCCSASSQLGTTDGKSFLSLETINHQHCDPQHNFTVKDPDSNLLSNYISGKPSKYNPTFNQLVGRTASRQDSGLKSKSDKKALKHQHFEVFIC